MTRKSFLFLFYFSFPYFSFGQGEDNTLHNALNKLFQGYDIKAPFDTLVKQMMYDTVRFEVSHFSDSITNETFLTPKHELFSSFSKIVLRHTKDQKHEEEYLCIFFQTNGGLTTKHKYRKLKRKFRYYFHFSHEDPLDTFFCGIVGKTTSYYLAESPGEPDVEIWRHAPCDLTGWSLGLKYYRR